MQSFQENTFENIVYKMAAILSRERWVDTGTYKTHKFLVNSMFAGLCSQEARVSEATILTQFSSVL